MKDRTGAQIGPYEIIAPLGAGGMGEVYRAWDPRLHREVALKLLAGHVAEDPSRRRRFIEEARAAGALNHPNIVAVYDVGVGEDMPFIVSELLEGKQLRDEIDRGNLSIKRILDLACQVAAGLRAAHDAGIAHRDLKPENVMITRDGRVKILDFGLAKAYAAATSELPGIDAATITATGIIVGTPHYMSPEQASGATVDFRSDQFSFGVMLYELAGGAHPFRRQTAVQTMSAIVADEPHPLGELNPRVPLLLRWIIERCLAKDPADRYASTADLAKDLATMQARLTEVTADDLHPVAAPTRTRRKQMLAIAGVLAVLAAAVIVLVPSSGSVLPPFKFTPLVTDVTFQGAPAWSPDGTAVAYVSAVDGVLQIFTKSLASSLPHQVTNSRFDCSDPFWSPDGTRIYYHSLARDAEGLWSVSAAGGPPEIVVENASRTTISRDNTLAYFHEAETAQRLVGSSRAIWLSSPTGKDVRRYTQPPFDKRTFVDGTLRFSPDGSKALAWVWGWADAASTVPSSEFWILPFPTGPPRRILPALSRGTPAAASFDWIDERRIVISLWDTSTGTHLWMADVENGSTTPLTSTPGSENRPAVSPDRKTVAFAAEAIDFDLIEIPLDGTPIRRLLATSRNELDPTFTPDGSQYAYVSDKGGALQIWLRSRDGQFERPVVGAAQFPDDETVTLGAPALSPKGDRIAYQRYSERSGYQVWVSTVAAAGPPVQLAAGSYYQDAPAWSPDGEWIAFVERTQFELTKAPGSDRIGVSDLAKTRVGTNQPREIILKDVPLLESRPRWSPDGRWIACDTIDGLAVVAADGKQPRVISEEVWIAFAWAADSRHVYGLREADRARHFALSVIDIETSAERVINPDLGLIPPASQPIRGLTLLGTGSLASSVASARSDIWLAEGLDRHARSWLARFWTRP